MLTKATLREYRWIKVEIQQVESKIRVIRNRAMSAGTMNFSGMPPVGGVPDPVAAAVEALDELRTRYTELLVELAKRQSEIEDVIATLDSVERVIMRMRYIDGWRWEDVAEHVGYSLPQTYVIHRRAMKKLKIE